VDVKRQVKIERVSPAVAGNGTPVEKAPDPDLGYDIIPAERYTSREFMTLEWKHVWTKVWLLAGRSDDIPEPGDYICTDIGKAEVRKILANDEQAGWKHHASSGGLTLSFISNQ
jgi:hypothetical protein